MSSSVKPAVQSTTVWSDAATILLGALAVAGSTGLIPPSIAGALQPLVVPALTVAAGIVGIIGRFRPNISSIQGWVSSTTTQERLMAAAQVAAKIAVAEALGASVQAAAPLVALTPHPVPQPAQTNGAA